MELSFKNERLKKLCENHKKMFIKYGCDQAEKIIQRINELQAAETLYDISKLPQTNLHPLAEDLNGFFAVNLINPYRLLFSPVNGVSSDLKTITKIKIFELKINYH
ncbi:MAG: type II toxin-antitoxin system RelE/ParE family toxin [Patescibacteria group bacterium]|jgi:proteic killer suppression protein